ncbi:hypothetical protein E5D57_006237 [Metarhizium anisopliae]|nr:hypothetical protein E5D57_006237 [Metarhizium anisopliae]
MITIRSEVEEILDWLRNKNGVTGIHELRVSDSLYIPHSEEVIEKCLTGFDIEVLDWKRVDLSIEPLFSGSRLVCPNLKKLTLYASGWIALQYWTSQEVQKSLRKFPKDLIGYALSEEYEERCRSNFDKTLAALGQPQDFTFNVGRDIWAVSPAKEAELHGPRKCTAVEVTRLESFLSAYQILQRQFLDENWRAQLLKDATPSYMPHIKVAIIDTGVDPGSIQCSHIQGSSFVSSGSGESPWWFSQHPHGTQMAKIITELDPFCQLLVAKVGDYSRDMTGERVKKV